MNVGQTKVASLKSIGQSSVIETQQMQQRRIQVMDMHWVGYDIESKVIRLAVNISSFESAPSKPHAEAAIVMIASIISSLNHRRSTELATPNDQRVIKKPTLLQVLNQCSARAIRVRGIRS